MGAADKQKQGDGVRKKLLRALMWAAAVFLLVWIFRQVEPGGIVRALDRTQYAWFALSVFGFSFATLFLDSFAHLWVFRRFNPPADYKSVLRARGESYLLLSLGFLYGQGGMAWSFSGKTGKPLSEVAGSLLFLMLNNLIALMAFPTISVLFFLDTVATPEFRASKEWSIIFWWLVISWPLIILHFVFWSREWDLKVRKRAKEGVYNTFHSAGPGDYAVALGFRWLQVVLWVLFSLLGLMAVQVDVSIKDLFLLGPFVALAAVIPTPGRFGTSQGAWLLLFEHLAQPAGIVAFSLLWTLSVNLIRWATGAVFLALPGSGPKGKAPEDTLPQDAWRGGT